MHLHLLLVVVVVVGLQGSAMTIIIRPLVGTYAPSVRVLGS